MYICAIVTATSADKRVQPTILDTFSTWKEGEAFSKYELTKPEYSVGATIELYKCDKDNSNIDFFNYYRVYTKRENTITISCYRPNIIYIADQKIASTLRQIYEFGLSKDLFITLTELLTQFNKNLNKPHTLPIMTILACRISAKKTQEEIATGIKSLSKNIYNWENGARAFTYIRVLQIARYCGVDRNWFDDALVNYYMDNITTDNL